MGKMRAKKRAAMSRRQPTGLPSPAELKSEEPAEEILKSQPILERLSNPSASERRWGCQSLSHLVLDSVVLSQLLQSRVVRRLTPLLLDQAMDVREAAAGALRNMSSVSDPSVHEHIASEDIMTPLSASLKDSLSQLDTLAKEKQKMAEREVLLRTLEEGLCLLWNMSENSSLVVEVFNRENLLPVLLQLLHPIEFPLSLCLAAAQVLHVVTEDNSPAVELLSSSPTHLSQLEGVLTHPSPGDLTGQGRTLLMRTAVAGVFENLLPSLPEAVGTATLRGVLSVIGTVVDTDLSPLMATSQETKDSVVEAMALVLSAKELASEVLANICYTEGDESDCEWEECSDSEDTETQEMMDDSQATPTDTTPSIKLVVELSLHSKVLAMFQNVCSTFDSIPKSLHKRLSSLLSTILLTLQNLVSCLPSGSLDVGSLWGSLFLLPVNYSDSTFPAVGLLISLLEKMEALTFHQLITEEQVVKVCELGRCASDTGVRGDVMRALGSAARLCLLNTSTTLPLLNIIATSLRDCVAKDTSLAVVCQALDSIFDMFGSDSCPPELFTSVQLLPVLREATTTFHARFRCEKKALGSSLPLVKSAKVNLPRFIDYMSSKH